MRSLFNMVRRLWSTYWRIDRIRIPPDEGLLFRLPVHSTIEVDGQPFVVLSRNILRDSAGPFLEYRCSNENYTALLLVFPAQSDSRSRVCWQRDRDLHFRLAGSIRVYEHRSCRERDFLTTIR